jgi:hypothetical protein
MSINRILMKANGSTIEGEDELIMTMGQQGYQYGYSRYNATYGEVEGNVKHDGKAVTLVMLSYYGSWLDFAFNVEGVTGGKYNVTVKVTSVESNMSATIEFPNIQYQSYVPGFYEYVNKLPSAVATMFNGKNVGKKYRVEIIFN